MLIDPYLSYAARILSYAVWIVFLAGGTLWSGTMIVLAAKSLLSSVPRPESKVRFDMLIVPFLLAMVSMFTLICFTQVFIINGSSNVAQGNDAGTFQGWSYWVHAWPWASGSNLAIVPIVGVFVVLPPYPHRDWKSSLCRLFIFLGALLSLYHAIAFAPRA